MICLGYQINIEHSPSLPKVDEEEDEDTQTFSQPPGNYGNRQPIDYLGPCGGRGEGG